MCNLRGTSTQYVIIIQISAIAALSAPEEAGKSFSILSYHTIFFLKSTMILLGSPVWLNSIELNFKLGKVS